jgi:hypothetical protein
MLCFDNINETLEKYDSGSTEVGVCEVCAWCLEGGELFICRDGTECPYSFCKECIETNLGEEVVESIEKAELWECFICNPSLLKHNYSEKICKLQDKSIYNDTTVETINDENTDDNNSIHTIHTINTEEKNIQRDFYRLEILNCECETALKNLETDSVNEKEKEIRLELQDTVADHYTRFYFIFYFTFNFINYFFNLTSSYYICIISTSNVN